MNKTASILTLAFIIELVIVISIFGIMIYKAEKTSETDSIVKKNIAENFGMMINALAASPGDVIVSYPTKLTKYKVTIDKNGAAVSKKDEPKEKRLIVNFVTPKSFSISGTVSGKDYVCLEKKAETILLRSCETGET